MPFFVSLLLANVLQAIGALINGRWVSDRNVVPGHLCRAQGGIKQAGNVGMALWYALSPFPFVLRSSHVIRPNLQVLCALSACFYAAVCSTPNSLGSALLGPLDRRVVPRGF